MVVELFDIFAVVPIKNGEAVETLFEVAILAIPKSRCKDSDLIPITKGRYPIFAPPIGL